MNNDTQIRRAGNTYWRRHAQPAVQRKTRRERPALFTFSGNLSPLLHKREPWWRRVTWIYALVLCVCVVVIVALAFAMGRT